MDQLTTERVGAGGAAPLGANLRMQRAAPPPAGPTTRVLLYDLINHLRPVFVSFPPNEAKGITHGIFQLNHPDHPHVTIDPLVVSEAPVDLTAMVPHEHLKKCGDLFKGVRLGYLKVWDPREAEEYLGTHGDEAARIKREVAAIMEADKNIDPRYLVRAESGSPEDLIDPRVVQLCLDVREDPNRVEDVLGELMQMERTLPDAELDYIYSWSGSHPIQQWAQRTVAKRSTDPEWLARVEAENKRLIEERRARGASGDLAGVGSTMFDENIVGGGAGALDEAAQFLSAKRAAMRLPSDPGEGGFTPGAGGVGS